MESQGKQLSVAYSGTKGLSAGRPIGELRHTNMVKLPKRYEKFSRNPTAVAAYDFFKK